MSRRFLRVPSLLLACAVLACASPTAPSSVRSRITSPTPGAAFDETTPTDTTCRSGYNVSQGHSC